MEKQVKSKTKLIIFISIGVAFILSGIILLIVICSTVPSYSQIKGGNIVDNLSDFKSDEQTYESLNENKYYKVSESIDVSSGTKTNETIFTYDLLENNLKENENLNFSKYYIRLYFTVYYDFDYTKLNEFSSVSFTSYFGDKEINTYSGSGTFSFKLEFNSASTISFKLLKLPSYEESVSKTTYYYGFMLKNIYFALYGV